MALTMADAVFADGANDWDGTKTLTDGGADQTSDSVQIDDSYQTVIHVELENNAALTAGAQVQIEVSPDNTQWYEFGGPMVGGTTNADVYPWGGIVIPLGVQYVRLVAGSNTGGSVDIHAHHAQVTARS